MDVHSNLERNWQQFPLLAKVITERSGVPEHLYKGGLSYHTILDDFHDWMLMGSQVVAPNSFQLDTSNVESPNDIDRIHHGLHRELAGIQSRIRLVAQFLTDLQDNLQETENRVHAALDRWNKEAMKNGADQPATDPDSKSTGIEKPELESEGAPSSGHQASDVR